MDLGQESGIVAYVEVQGILQGLVKMQLTHPLKKRTTVEVQGSPNLSLLGKIWFLVPKYFVVPL